MVFATSAILCWGQKSTKNDQKSIQKQLSNPCSNLCRFESQLGLILGGFWTSRWGQVGTKSLQKSIFKSMTKMIAFQIALGTDFDRFWAPTWSPNRPRYSHLGAKSGPRPPQDPSKTSQNPLKSSPKSIQNRNLIFDPFWDRFLLIFHQFSTPKSTKNQSKSIKKSSQFGRILEPNLSDF